MKLTPYLLGSGRAADALRKSLAVLELTDKNLSFAPSVTIERGKSFPDVSKVENAILLIANPHGLHAKAIRDGEKAGFKAIIVEKPACVNLEEIKSLESLKIPVAICHVYRQMWGVQTLKKMLSSGEFGELITIEGRYWQSSSAKQALEGNGPRAGIWKNDVWLSGASDTLIDVGVHWVDTVSFLMGENSFKGRVWKSYANAETSHRDTHVQLNLEYSAGKRAMGSISKTLHGATNHFEVNVVGTKQAATWNFLTPDELFIGKGNTRSVVVRGENTLGSGLPAFHAMGWIEGYVEIIRQVIGELKGEKVSGYPDLKGNLNTLKSLFLLEG